MTSPIIDRQHQLTLSVALNGTRNAYLAAEARLRTLDRAGIVLPSEWTVMRLIADARAGRRDEFTARVSSLNASDPAAADRLRVLLLSAPEAELKSFRSFVEKELPQPSESGDLSRGKSVKHVVAVIAVTVVFVGISVAAVSWGFSNKQSNSGVSGVAELNAAPNDGSLKSGQPNDSTMYDRYRQITGIVVLRVEIMDDDGTTIKLPIGTGTGFAIRRNGLVLTNRHVVEGGPALQQKNRVVVGWDIVFVLDSLAEPLVLPARIVNQSAYADLAFLQVDYVFPWQAEFAPTPSPGQRVYAIGFPGVAENVVDELNESEFRKRMADIRSSAKAGMGLDLVQYIGRESLKPTLTDGIISAVRSTEHGMMLQTNAAIHGGNSGGPLIDEHGRVVGVNTLRARNAESISMAISARTVWEQIPREPDIRWPVEFR